MTDVQRGYAPGPKPCAYLYRVTCRSPARSRRRLRIARPLITGATGIER